MTDAEKIKTLRKALSLFAEHGVVLRELAPRARGDHVISDRSGHVLIMADFDRAVAAMDALEKELADV